MALISESSVLLLEKPAGPAGTPDSGPTWRSPALGLIAALSTLEGYRWLGIIPAGDFRLPPLVIGRTSALAFACLSLFAVWAMTRPHLHGRRPFVHRLVVLTAAVALMAVVVVLASDTGMAADVLGIAELVLASASAGALIAAERQERRTQQRLPATSTDHAYPAL